MNENNGAPDVYDRLLGGLDGLPDVTNTKPTTLRSITPLIGNSQTFIVQTYRQRDRGDTIFLECVDGKGSVRLALPPVVAEAIARQRDALTTKVRVKVGKQSAADRKARGEVPGFAKKRAKA